MNKLKGFLHNLMIKAKGYEVGTVRTWADGKKRKKVTPTKWALVYDGAGTRGEKQAVGNVRKKIQNAQSFSELATIIKENKERFQDKSGNYLPVVGEFIASAKEMVPKEKEESKPKDKENPSKEEPKGIDKLKEKYQSGKSVDGKDAKIYSGKEKIKGQWKLVEADSPSASHDEKTFSKTDGFPTNDDGSTINDRDYEKDKQAQEQVVKIAGDFDGRALHYDTPIIVSPDGVVISGNNRTMSSKLAASKGTDKEYIEELKDRAELFGFKEEDFKEFKNPRVVFEIPKKEYSTKEFAKFNESETKQMNPVEQAVKASKTVDVETIEGVANTLSEYDTLGELYAKPKEINKVFDSLEKGGVINSFNRPQYVTEDGISGAGKEFLETVLIGSVVSGENIRALNKPGMKGYRKKLVRAITPLVENKSLDGYSINKELNTAIDILNQYVANSDKFNSLEEMGKQGDFFEGIDPVGMKLAETMQGTEKGFAEFMEKMNGGLKVGASGQQDIFLGETESKEDIVSRMLGVAKSIGSRIIIKGGKLLKVIR